MAMSSWMLRSQMTGFQGRRLNLRSGKQSNEKSLFETLIQQEPDESFTTILSKLCEEDVDEKDLLNHLNTFVKLLQHYENDFDQIQISRQDILICLKVVLLHESSVIRSAGLRCIRHTIQDEAEVAKMNVLVIPFLISRSLDLKNDLERLEAVKLVRKLFMIAPTTFDVSMIRSLISLANEGLEVKDRLLRVGLATLIEIGAFNPSLFIECDGVATITRNLIDCQIPKIAEALCGVLLLLLDRPETRNRASVDLHSLAAPFCDFHFKNAWKDKTRDERQVRLNCSRLALLTLLKSWPGLLHFCSPRDQGGFKAIVSVLYLNQREVRRAVLDLFFDLLGLQQPEWTDELSVAFSAIDPCEHQSSWRLKEDFVAAEGKFILPHLAKTTPSPTEMHLALLLFSFLECGLFDALTEVITNSDPFISVRATVLLSELLRLIQLYLPSGCCNFSPSLSSLIDYATASKPQAMAAVTALQQLHKLMQKRPASYSLHLDYIIRNSSNRKSKHKQEKHSRNKGIKSKINQVKTVLKDGDDIVQDTGVLWSNDVKLWDWSLIQMILKGESRRKLDLTDSSHKLFLKRLLDFFTPSQNKYSHMDLGSSPNDSVGITTSGIEFIKFLGEVNDADCQSMLTELFKDIHTQIKAIKTSRSIHDCLFSPSHMTNTHCQSYFLFIGQFVRCESGREILDGIKMFSLLQELATTTHHDCYVKLIISSLDYSVPGPAREILDAVLTCDIESSRLYATQFLLVLLRVGYPSFAGWATRLLCRQLEDKSRKVVLSALSTLHEACELPDCLETLTDLPLSLTKMGEKGELLYIRMLSTEKGFKRCGEDKILSVISKWDTHMNYRYVRLVEGDISDAITLHQRDEDGKYERAVSNAATRNYRKDTILPPHLYGQLNQHAEGFRMLTANGSITSLVEFIHKGICGTDDEILKLKAALWAIGHLSTSKMGFEYLNSLEFLCHMISLATKCPVFGVRSTAFYALGLVATTSLGADELNMNGWLAVRHNRHERWPIIQQEPMDTYYISYFTSSVWDQAKYTTASGDGTSDDEITLSEEDDRLINCPISPPDFRTIKQSTLPAVRTPPEPFHKRSLSESKTFDTASTLDVENKYPPYDNVIVRLRNSSITESTTSGVSSCDSLPNRPGGGVSYLQTLSPIPSSTSLSGFKLPKPVERYSHRISSNSASSDVSSTLSGGNANELSLQNMLGYQTIRYIRRRDSLNFRRTERDDYLFRPPPPTSTGRSFTAETLTNNEPTATIHYSSLIQPKLQPMYDFTKTHKPRDAIYRGVCLPKNLSDLFPDDELEFNKSSTVSNDSINTLNPSTGHREKTTWKHSAESCICCSEKVIPLITDFAEDPAKSEILKTSERLANPVLSKIFKNQLLRLKQKDPKQFKDVCVYSEICKMFSESNYTLINRRVLHELFLDVCFDECFEAARKMFPIKEQKRHSLHEATSPTEFKTLDSLNLISVENKFPIKNRDSVN